MTLYFFLLTVAAALVAVVWWGARSQHRANAALMEAWQQQKLNARLRDVGRE